MIKRSIPRSSQPQYYVPPNGSLLGAPPIHLLNFGVGLVGLGERKTYTSTAITYAAGSAIFNGSTAFITAETSALGIANGFALACRFKANTIGAIQGLLVKDYSSDGDRCLQFRVDAAGALNFIRFDAAKSVITNITGGTVTAGRWHTAVAFFSGTGSGIYLDGKLVASDSVTTTNNDISASTPLLIGCGYSAATHANTLFLGGSIAAAAVLKKLPTELCRGISDNIWQIFTPQQRNIYVSVAGGGLNVTGLLGTADATGLTANVDKQLAITATLATATAAGLTAQVDTQAAITATLATSTADGLTANVDKQFAISGTLATATADGIIAGVDTQLAIAGSLATATAGGIAATIDQQLAIAATLATATADGTTATIDRQLTIAGALATATADGIQATISNGLTINATLATATAAGFNANIDQQIAISGSLAAAIADGLNASIAFGNDLNISASLGTATASGLTAGVDSQTAVTAILGQATADGFSASVTLASSWAGEPFNFASPITRTFDFTSSITKNLNFESPI